MWRKWDFTLDWAPFFLDPSIPPTGRERTPRTTPDMPPTPIEVRGQSLGIEFRRGNRFQPHTHRALEAGEFAARTGTTEQIIDYHLRLFKAHFTDFENLMDLDVLVRHAADAGLDAQALRETLETGTLVEDVDRGIEHSYEIGVSGIPTFILNDQYAIVGAQDYETFERVFTRIGVRLRDGSKPAEA